MTLLLIVYRSLRQHALSTAVTVVSTALACGLIMSVFAVKTQTHDAFTGGPVGFDAVLGALVGFELMKSHKKLRVES